MIRSLRERRPLAGAIGAALLLAILAAPAAGGRAHAQAGFIYVSTDGDDGNDGSSVATAFRTLRQALRTAAPGDTVRVLPGTYAETVKSRVRGRADAPILIVGYGGRPVFTGERRLRYGLWLEESQYIVVERLEFRDYTDIGLLVVLSSHVTLRKLKVRGNGFDPRINWVEGYGIHLDESTDLLVVNNRVFDNGPNPRPWNGAGTGINGYMMTRAIIRNNRSFRNHGGGILVEDSVDVLVRRNRIYENDLDVSADEWWDGGIWLDGGRDVRLIGNIIETNLGPGIEISDEDCQSPTGYVVKDNVSIGNYYGIFIWHFGTTDFPPSEILEMSGNTFADNTRLDVWIEGSLEDC